MVMVRIIATAIIPVKNNSVQDQEEMKKGMKNSYILIYFEGQVTKNLEDTIGCLWNKG